MHSAASRCVHGDTTESLYHHDPALPLWIATVTCALSLCLVCCVQGWDWSYVDCLEARLVRNQCSVHRYCRDVFQ